MKNIKSYSEIIQDLSEEIGISTEDTKSLVDVALSSVDIKKINYEDFNEEILMLDVSRETLVYKSVPNSSSFELNSNASYRFVPSVSMDIEKLARPGC